MEYKAEMVNGELIVKPNIIKNGNDIIVQVPSLALINKTIREYNGERNIQQI